ncbi:DUF3189 family protein [Bacillus massiliigorillae]|uniref:DUF3189 family protein n=1 Tax=Bacillus massiliigorillae TaxID=1243664 RepID=UPI0003A10DCF|nr:DUF3189 family protein [Bacillus massiliigorillae]
MIYIYNDYGGTHTTSLAAAHHLEILKEPTYKLSTEEVLEVPYFNKLTKSDFGRLIYHGKDSNGDLVYTVGRKRSKLVVPALKDFGSILLNHFNSDEHIIFSNTSPTVPLVMSLGGFFSRGLGIDSIGVPLLVKGAQKCNMNIYKLVEHTKEVAVTRKKRIIVLDNQEFKI